MCGDYRMKDRVRATGKLELREVEERQVQDRK